MTQIICISHQRWEDALTRTRRLLPLSPETELLFFEPAIPGFSFSAQRLRRPREGQVVSPGITLYTLPSTMTLEEDFAATTPGQIEKNANFILRAMQEHHFRSPLLWCTSPLCAPLPGALPHGGVVYDCGENWSHMVPPAWEAQLCEEADLLLTASPLLQDRLRDWGHNLVLLPNGYDRALYQQDSEKTARIPADIANIPAPVFGWIGDIPEQCSLSPILYAAKTEPGWQFVLAGAISPYQPQLSTLKKLPNVHLLGTKSPVSHPYYLRQFTVALELLDAEPAADTLSAPFFGALHTGSPMVLLSEREARLYPDVVYSAHFEIEFVDACRRALAENSELLRRTRQRYAAEADWVVRREDCLRMLRASALL